MITPWLNQTGQWCWHFRIIFNSFDYFRIYNILAFTNLLQTGIKKVQKPFLTKIMKK